VARSTLHNEAEVTRLKLYPGEAMKAMLLVQRRRIVRYSTRGCLFVDMHGDCHSGARVSLKRSGDVIPKILGLARPPSSSSSSSSEVGGGFRMPERCPVCGSAVEAILPSRSSSSSGARHRCTGGAICSAQVVELLRYTHTHTLTQAGAPRPTLQCPVTLHRTVLVC
jgi:NAD-dependent DNA ligase